MRNKASLNVSPEVLKMLENLKTEEDVSLIPFRRCIDDIEQWGFCTSNKKIVIDCEYDDVSGFSEDLALIKKDIGEEEKWGFIDRQGKIIINVKYDNARSFSEGLAAVSLYGRREFDDISERWALVNNKWGFIDNKDVTVIPFIYDSAYSFSEGFAAVCLEGKWGFIDKQHKVAIPFIYEMVANGFSDGLSKVSESSYEDGGLVWGFIDKNGTQYWED